MEQDAHWQPALLRLRLNQIRSRRCHQTYWTIHSVKHACFITRAGKNAGNTDGTAQRRQRRMARVLQMSAATQTSRRNSDRVELRVCYVQLSVATQRSRRNGDRVELRVCDSCSHTHTIPPSDDATDENLKRPPRRIYNKQTYASNKIVLTLWLLIIAIDMRTKNVLVKKQT